MTRISILAACVFLAATTASAAETVRLHTRALTEQVVVNEKGEREVRLVEASRVTPGDEVVYAIHWENAGPAAAEAVVITNPVPEHMFCLKVEETAPARATVSIDGGKSFAPLAGLTVAMPDGTTRAATYRDCTHVRWTFDKPLSPGQKGTVHFRAGLE